MPTVEGDIAEVKRVHDEWWASNADFDIPRMRACFASGDKFLQYNLNGHTYLSVDELTQSWELIGQNYGIPELKVIDLRIEVRGERRDHPRSASHRAAAVSSVNRASTQRTPSGVSSLFQNGARVLR